MRWRDSEMWVDVGEKTIVTALAPQPEAMAKLHFLMRKTTWKQPHKAGGNLQLCRYSATLLKLSRATCSHAHAHKYATTCLHIQKLRLNNKLRLDLQIQFFLRIPIDVENKKT